MDLTSSGEGASWATPADGAARAAAITAAQRISLGRAVTIVVSIIGYLWISGSLSIGRA